MNQNTNTIHTDINPEDLQYYRHSLEFGTGVPFSDHNSIKILQNGDEIFPAMLDAIASATQTIDFMTFVYWKGEIAEKFADLLASRASQGVTVRVLLDAFGAKLIKQELVELMELSGVQVRWFRPLSTWRIWRSDKRTHRKILICDNRVGFTGGVGIARQWVGDARNPDEWRDTHLELTGPVLLGLRAAFLDNWNEAGDWLHEKLAAVDYDKAKTVPMQVIRASTTTGWTDTAGLIRELLAISRQSVRIVTAYFVPDPLLINLLIDTHKRGVKVELLLPGKHTDSRLSQLASHPSIEKLLKAGISIWLYQKTLLHAKILLVDDCVSCIGSANLNHRSMGKDEECCVVILSNEVTKQLHKQFEADRRDAIQLNFEEWSRRSLSLKLQEKFAGLLTEQL